MANNLIPEELQALINQYLTDGVLTDKERAVILKKAENMNLDRDEIDLYLDAEVQKIDQATDAAVRRQKGKTCPYCGGSVPQLTDKCPHCGENITAEASQELQEIFDNLEEALVDMKAGKDISRSKATVERYTRKAKMYFDNNPKVQKLLLEIEKETIETENRAKANARKNALLQFCINHKKAITWIIVILVVFFSYKVCTYSSDKEETKLREQYESQYKLDNSKIDKQFELLTEKINNLEEPNEKNYKEIARELQKIVWIDISKNAKVEDNWNGDRRIYNKYEKGKKDAFVKMKRAYAEELQAIYKSVYNYGESNSSYDENTPEIIRMPFLINE